MSNLVRTKPTRRELPYLEGLSRKEATRLLSGRTWTVKEYFALETQRRLEYSYGRIEVLPVATEIHQFIIIFLREQLAKFARMHAPGTVLFSGLRVRLWERVFRQPDVTYMAAEHDERRHNEYWEGADLVMEVVSGDRKDRKRDYEEKRQDYARAGIPEYWIVDPDKQVITVLSLKKRAYRVHGEFRPGETATSVLLPGSVAVDNVFSATGNSRN